MTALRGLLQDIFGIGFLSLTEADHVQEAVVGRAAHLPGDLLDFEQRVDARRQDEAERSGRRHLGDALRQLDSQRLDVARAQLLLDEEPERVRESVGSQGAQDAQPLESRAALPVLRQALPLRKFRLDYLAPAFRRRLNVAVQMAELVRRRQA